MRPGARASLRVAVACVAGVCAAARGAEPVDARISRLLAEAQAGLALKDAEQKIDRAQHLLANLGGSLGGTARDFLRADILRARGRVAAAAWKRDPSRADLRRRARRHLLEAVELYVRLVALCEAELDKLERRLTQADPSQNPTWRRLSGSVSRANYGEAWSLYTLALLAENETDRRGRLAQALERFAGFTANGYRNHPVVADCFLGQALCQYEHKRYAKVLELLKPAQPKNTPAGTYKRMTYLRIKAGQAYGSHLAAESAAKQYFDALPANHKPDAIELGMAVERARCLAVLADAKRNPEYHGLFRRRLDEVAKLIHDQGEPWRSELEEILGDSAGVSPFKCLARARAAFKAKRFAEAARQAEIGLRAAAPRTDRAVLADLRYARAASYLNLGKALDAHRAAAEFIRRHAADRRAADLCQPAVQAGLNALKDTPRLPQGELLRFLTLLERLLPTHPEVRKLPWHRGNLLLQASRFRQAEDALKTVRTDSGVYLLAQYGLAVAAAKQAEVLPAGADANAAAALLDRSAEAVGRFVASAGGELSPPERRAAGALIDVALAVAARNLDLAPPRPAAALALLDSADRLPSPKGAAARRKLALRVRALLLAGKADAAAAHVAKLLVAPRGADKDLPETLAGIAAPLAAEFERLRRQGPADAAASLGRQAVAVYTALLDLSADSKDDRVRRSEPAVRQRLAETLEQLGRFAEAIPHYQRLVRETPRGKAGRAIRGLAVCLEATGRHDLACEQWAALARGLEKGTEGWYEARYHWLWCLDRQGERARARRMLAYFRLQHPKIAIRRWKDRFQSLAERLGMPHTAPATRESK